MTTHDIPALLLRIRSDLASRRMASSSDVYALLGDHARLAAAIQQAREALEEAVRCMNGGPERRDIDAAHLVRIALAALTDAKGAT